MAKGSRDDSGNGIQRFLDDLREHSERRAHTDRRRRERRVRQEPTEVDRRSGRDRRGSGDRRTGFDRRIPNNDQFSLDEAQAIHRLVLHPDSGVRCPRCGGQLLLGPTEVHDGLVLRDVHCTTCRHSASIVE